MRDAVDARVARAWQRREAVYHGDLLFELIDQVAEIEEAAAGARQE
ncbi:hypothetical protein [Mesorhizobium sp.]|nr:hypothetical protein [Mesorhizobium sp.]